MAFSNATLTDMHHGSNGSDDSRSFEKFEWVSTGDVDIATEGMETYGSERAFRWRSLLDG